MKRRKRQQVHRPDPAVLRLRVHMWSSLTFTAFITAFITSIWLGAPGLMPFVYGAAAFLAILAIEACMRGRLWPFEDGYRQRLIDIDGIALRLLFFSGALLLVLESSLLIFLWI